MKTFSNQNFKKQFGSYFDNDDYSITVYEEGKVVIEIEDEFAQVTLENYNPSLFEELTRVNEKIFNPYDDFELNSYRILEFEKPIDIEPNPLINLLKENGCEIISRGCSCINNTDDNETWWEYGYIFSKTKHYLDGIEVIVIISKANYRNIESSRDSGNYIFLHLKKKNLYIQVQDIGYTMRLVNSVTNGGIIEEIIFPLLNISTDDLYVLNYGCRIIPVDVLLKVENDINEETLLGINYEEEMKLCELEIATYFASAH